MTVVDQPTRIREGEELDPKKIESFLKDNIGGLSGSIEIKQFPSGYSNLTYLVKVGDQEMVLRRPPFGKKAKSAHDMGREYRVLSSLYPVFPYCPRPLVYTEDETVMGCPFYVMERIRGIILRKDLPEGLALAPSDCRTLCEEMMDFHYRLHSIDYKAIGLADLGKPEGYVHRQVSGWSRRYRDAKTPDVPDYEDVMEFLAKNEPPDDPNSCIIHNDYKFDNLVLNPDNPLEIIGVLDWEMTTIGDPLMDLGNSLAYWVNTGDPEEMHAIATVPSAVEGMMTRRELVDRYAEKSGRNLDNFDFYYAFGLFRLAVIAQQIYYRYYHGQTTDKRFYRLGFVVGILENAAKRVMAGEGI